MDFLRRIHLSIRAPFVSRPTAHSNSSGTPNVREDGYERTGIPGDISYGLPTGIPNGMMPMTGMSSGFPAGPSVEMHRYHPAPASIDSSPRLFRTNTSFNIPFPPMAESTVALPLKNHGRQGPVNHVEKSAKIWSVYIRQSEINDNALMEKWMGDMDGLLIFAGLFSAVVTAFLVESIPMLQQDPEQTSAIILGRISTQLAGNNSQTNAAIPPLPPLQSLTSSTGSPLRLNILWSFSLFLGLLCALSATLVQQWARGYRQAVERRSAPLQRVRIRAFLYQGIESSGARTVATTIPTLLHLAVFLFIGGMYDFLVSSNQVIAFISIGTLCVFIGLYLALSVIPLGNLGSPYQTPLSSALWRLRQPVHPRSFFSPDGSRIVIKSNLAHGREQVAMNTFQDTAAQKREVDALIWTLESFTEDDEFEGFVEGIPGFLTSKRLTNARAVMRQLVEQTNLGMRIVKLLQTCVDADSLSRDARHHRAGVVLGALAALTKEWGLERENPKWIMPFESVTDRAPVWSSVISTLTRLQYPRTKDPSTFIHAHCTITWLHWRLLKDYLAAVYHIWTKIQSEDAGYAYIRPAAADDIGSWVTSMHHLLEGLSSPSKHHLSRSLGEEMQELDDIARRHSEQSIGHGACTTSEHNPNVVQADPNLIYGSTSLMRWVFTSMLSTRRLMASFKQHGKFETLDDVTRHAALHTKHLAISMGLIQPVAGDFIPPQAYMDACTRVTLQKNSIRQMIISARVANIIQLSTTIPKIKCQISTSERAEIISTLQFLISAPPPGADEMHYDIMSQQQLVVLLKFFQDLFSQLSAQAKAGADHEGAASRARLIGQIVETVVPFVNRVINTSPLVSEKDRILNDFKITGWTYPNQIHLGTLMARPNRMPGILKPAQGLASMIQNKLHLKHS